MRELISVSLEKKELFHVHGASTRFMLKLIVKTLGYLSVLIFVISDNFAFIAV